MLGYTHLILHQFKAGLLQTEHWQCWNLLLVNRSDSINLFQLLTAGCVVGVGILSIRACCTCVVGTRLR